MESLEPTSIDEVAFTELQDCRPVPLSPVFDAQDTCRLYLGLILSLVDIIVILSLQVLLVVGNHLVVG